MRQEVPDTLTPLTLDEAIEAFAEAYRRYFGQPPTPRTLAAVVGHSALETGHWKSMHGFNIGNEKAPDSWDGLVMTFKCDETFDAATAAQAKRLGAGAILTPKADGKVHVWLPAGHPWAYFKAFETAAEGLMRHFALLTLDRYERAWHYFCLGDAYNAALYLGASGYYTAPDKPGYSRVVASIAAKILPACTSYLTGDGYAIDDEMREWTLQEALVYSTLQHGIHEADTDPAPPPDDISGAAV
jgi:hypothetical protein